MLGLWGLVGFIYLHVFVEPYECVATIVFGW